MICPNCEREIENNVAQCLHCGCHLAVTIVPKPAPKPVPSPVVTEELKATPKAQEVPPSETQVTVAENICPYCGNMVAENAAFCKWCGLRVVQQEAATHTEASPPSTKFCKHCGKSITAAAAFCKWCGTPNSTNNNGY